MAKRKRISSSYNRKNFTRTARKVHKKNLVRSTARGGIRF